MRICGRFPLAYLPPEAGVVETEISKGWERFNNEGTDIFQFLLPGCPVVQILWLTARGWTTG
jgi:hypothetical protein